MGFREICNLLGWLVQNGGAAPSLVLLPKVTDGLVLSTRKQKRKLPFFHKNKLNCPKLVSWQELGVMKESQLFPCPFQRWGSHIPPLGPSAVAMLTEWQSPWYSSASCSCSWEGGREVTDWSWWEREASLGLLVVRAGPLPLLDLLGDLGARGK